MAGASAYALHRFQRMGRIARENGALFMVDIAHYAGLVAGGYPVPHADFVTSTTHKSLRGRARRHHDEGRAREDHQLSDLPGIQGGPLMHVIAGKAVAFRRFAPEFKDYAQQVVKNAKVLADTLVKRGLRIVSGAPKATSCWSTCAPGHHRQGSRSRAGPRPITVNKNAIPNDPEKPFVTSGIRLGAGLRRRGFTEAEAERPPTLIADVLDNPRDEAKHRRRACQGQRTDLAPAGLRPEVSACAVAGKPGGGAERDGSAGPSFVWPGLAVTGKNIEDEFSPLDDFHRTDRYNMLNSCHPAFRDHMRCRINPGRVVDSRVSEGDAIRRAAVAVLRQALHHL